MNTLRMVLRHGKEVEEHLWPLNSANLLVSTDEWKPHTLSCATRVTMENSSTGAGNWILHLTAEDSWLEDVIAEVHISLPSGTSPTHILWPKYYGVFERFPHVEDELSKEFRGAGRPARNLADEDRLALPFAVLEEPQGNWLLGTDPTFSTTITLKHSGNGQSWLVLSWTWLAAAGVHADEHRRLFIQPIRDVRAALDRWFKLATPEVPQGPAWLHDIALQDYDFFSKNGQGWYADIDASCRLIVPQDRHRALFCLHGWYDQIGRYCYNTSTKTLDEHWTTFPYINHPDLLTLMTTTPVSSGFPTPAAYAFRNLKHYHPVPFSWQHMRDRLRYAKERGLRTAVYVMTGMEDAGEWELHALDGTGLDVDAPLWRGPELVGQTYMMNPLHPEVRAKILGYTQALLEKVGDLTDALVLDEAYYVGYGMLGPKTCPGYADRAQFSLIHEMTALCHSYRPDLAFLTADLLGAPGLEQRAFPYCLAADGIYQDSWCWPQTWDCVRFPAWRNVAWSCNWAPVSNLSFTRWGVLAHHAPVAISNGCFGDDMGISDVEPDIFAQIAALWHARTSKKCEKAAPVIDVLL